MAEACKGNCQATNVYLLFNTVNLMHMNVKSSLYKMYNTVSHNKSKVTVIPSAFLLLVYKVCKAKGREKEK